MMTEEDLKNLPPEERLKRLKELEQKKKKEIEEAQKLIRESEEEITEERKFREKVPLPEFAKMDLEGLSREGKEILKLKGVKEDKKENNKDDNSEEEEDIKENREEKREKSSGLEELTRGNVDISPEIINSEYAAHLSQKPMKDIYQEMTRIRESVDDKGYMTPEEERKVEYLASAVEKKIEAEESGTYSFTERTANAASITRQLGNSLMNNYRRHKSEGLYKS